MKNKIPSDEDFDRASAAMERMDRFYSEISEDTLTEFTEKAAIHRICIFPDGVADCRVYIFYESDLDIVKSRENGVEEEIKRYISYLMTSRSNAISEIAFELDSHEKVCKEANGNYLQYLR